MNRAAARPGLGLVSIAGIFCTLVIVLGWSQRGEHYVSAEFGTGYALGIVGLAMMTLLLSYSARKHLRFMARWGPIRRWFHVHMALGLLGPTAVLVHCNFDLGSTNSAVALICMLLVSGSGVVGRVVYTRIHEQLSGRRRTVQELQQEIARGREALEKRGIAPDLAARLAELERFATQSPAGPLSALWRFVAVGSKARSAARSFRRASRGQVVRGEVSGDVLRSYLTALRSAARFSAYERTFALWHAFHLPLCFLLFASAGIHVFAVHSY